MGHLGGPLVGHSGVGSRAGGSLGWVDKRDVGIFLTLTVARRPRRLLVGIVGRRRHLSSESPRHPCVGGGSNVPLGFVSLTENLMMIFMGVWMSARAMGLF